MALLRAESTSRDRSRSGLLAIGFLDFEPAAQELEALFGSDYVQDGTTHLLGFTHRHAD